MKYQKITNLFDKKGEKISKFSNKKWEEVYDQSEMSYSTSRQIRFKTSMLRSGLCDYFDAYIIVKREITVAGPNDNVYDKKLALENNVSFFSCISTVNNTLIDNANELL